MSQIYLADSGSLPGTPNIEFVQGNTGGPVGPDPGTHIITIIGDTAQGVYVNGNAGTFTETITVQDATTSTKGVASFDPADFVVVAGVVSAVQTTSASNYTAVDTAMSPYAVTATDYFISCDSTAGPITLLFPNAPTANREFVVKDRVGQAGTNGIIVTTVGGVVTIDGATSYTFSDNYESVEMLFNGTSYETF